MNLILSKFAMNKKTLTTQNSFFDHPECVIIYSRSLPKQKETKIQ